jgi:hypothetical protein
MSEALRVVPLDWPPGTHDLRSAYVERYWLPVLGPSAVCLLRRIADSLDAHPDGFDLDLAETAAALGLSGQARRVQRTCERLVAFNVAQYQEEGVLAVRRALPNLPPGRVRKLPPALAAELRAQEKAE